ncbi:AER130Wp [Eremothecium gossypii ATCC 10895]|uniref:AER130Wp n=1 Tax=Eremothecium gossypii (strain ATCC 10895 / CBS 109.51 / FGSC 9923 / NRRL Y-1056) TaxID=284811 RepID=Q756Y4_EREGS|nr:AER130Wp [Eremothecium gossypii ATCC 10895]AAS52813.1 AER130Wp [Eremothecium gossypii ATCC 10895]AEY97119.1 FAER130Wp [Eremothecium gossypii FDAG1]
MITQDQMQQVQKRLAVYQQGSYFASYLSSVGQVHELCQAILLGQLDEEHAFSQEAVQRLRDDIKVKYLENKIMIESDKLRTDLQDSAVETGVGLLKERLPERMAAVEELAKEMEVRNARLRQMTRDVEAFNRETRQLATNATTLRWERKEWENLLGVEEFGRLLESGIFQQERSGLYLVKERLFEGEDELQRINALMKADIERLSRELQQYQARWLQNAGVLERIGQILEQETLLRKGGQASDDVDMDENDGNEEDEEDEADDESFARRLDGSGSSDNELDHESEAMDTSESESDMESQKLEEERPASDAQLSNAEEDSAKAGSEGLDGSSEPRGSPALADPGTHREDSPDQSDT